MPKYWSLKTPTNVDLPFLILCEYYLMRYLPVNTNLGVVAAVTVLYLFMLISLSGRVELLYLFFRSVIFFQL